MRTAYRMTREELEDVVDTIQRLVYGKYRVVGGNDVDFLDADKEVAGADLLESISIALDQFDLVPELGAKSLRWRSASLHVCDECHFAFEQTALQPLRGADANGRAEGKVAPTGRCPRCDDYCRPIPAAALTDESSVGVG